MSVVIRLSRHGKKDEPIYRVVAADEDYPCRGRYLEILGTYYPKGKDNRASFKDERVKFWLSKGARVTDTVGRLIKRAGI
jgi:small subunit ribosomal protein S16